MENQQTTKPDTATYFNEILMYITVPVYMLFLGLGMLTGGNTVGTLFIIMIMTSHHAIRKTLEHFNVDIATLVASGIYKKIMPTLVALSVIHFLANTLLYDLFNPVSSVVAFGLCYLMMFFAVKTYEWLSFVKRKRESRK